MLITPVQYERKQDCNDARGLPAPCLPGDQDTAGGFQVDKGFRVNRDFRFVRRFQPFHGIHRQAPVGQHVFNPVSHPVKGFVRFTADNRILPVFPVQGRRYDRRNVQ